MRHVLLFISLQGKGDHLSEFLSSLGDSSTSSIIEDFDFPSGEYWVLLNSLFFVVGFFSFYLSSSVAIIVTLKQPLLVVIFVIQQVFASKKNLSLLPPQTLLVFLFQVHQKTRYFENSSLLCIKKSDKRSLYNSFCYSVDELVSIHVFLRAIRCIYCCWLLMIMSSGWYKFTSKVSQKKKALNLLKLLFDWFDSTGFK